MASATFRTVVFAALTVAFFAFASAAMAAAGAPQEAAPAALAQSVPEPHDVVPVTIWTIVGCVVGGLLLGVLYLLKKRVGGFPEHPDWVAPISIERSATFPQDGDYGDVAHDAHGSHH